MCSTTLQLGLSRFELQGLELHGQAHVPSDLQLALEEGLHKEQTVSQSFNYPRVSYTNTCGGIS